jgi:hypothetical protein
LVVGVADFAVVVVVGLDDGDFDLPGLEASRAGTITHFLDFPTRLQTNVDPPCTLVRPTTAHALEADTGCETESTDTKTAIPTSEVVHLKTRTLV